MKLSIEHKGNYQYAKIPGKSYRVDGKVRKKGVVYRLLGHAARASSAEL